MTLITLTVLSATSALIRYGESYRILLGASTAPQGSVDLVLVQRVSVEEIAGLPVILRRQRGVIQCFSTSPRTVDMMLQNDEALLPLIQKQPLNRSAADMLIHSDMRADWPNVIATGPGLAVVSEPDSWTRLNDCTRCRIITWDPNHPMADTILRAYADLDHDAEMKVAEAEQELSEQITKAKDAGEVLPNIWIKRYLWAPFCMQQPSNYRLMWAQRRAPLDLKPDLNPKPPAFIGCAYTDDHIGTEYVL